MTPYEALESHFKKIADLKHISLNHELGRIGNDAKRRWPSSPARHGHIKCTDT